MMKKKNIFIALLLISVTIFSCKKEEGKGGRASIKGKVLAYPYNESFSQVGNSYYIPEEDVYIIYGDNINYDDRVKTGPDGTFEFKHLRKGNYTIYTYSADSSSLSVPKVEAIYEDAEVVDKDEVVELPDFVIIKVVY